MAYSDAEGLYDRKVADRLMAIVDECGASPQAAVLGASESDASHAKAGGLAAQAGLLCLPTLSTHGYEVVHRDGIAAISQAAAELALTWDG